MKILIYKGPPYAKVFQKILGATFEPCSIEKLEMLRHADGCCRAQDRNFISYRSSRSSHYQGHYISIGQVRFRSTCCKKIVKPSFSDEVYRAQSWNLPLLPLSLPFDVWRCTGHRRLAVHECCDEYITLYNFTEEFKWCFTLLAHIYIWANFLSRLGLAEAWVTVRIAT